MSKYKSGDDIEGIAMGLYYLDWKQLPSGNFPPTWENTTNEIREWMRDQVRKELELLDFATFLGEIRCETLQIILPTLPMTGLKLL